MTARPASAEVSGDVATATTAAAVAASERHRFVRIALCVVLSLSIVADWPLAATARKLPEGKPGLGVVRVQYHLDAEISKGMRTETCTASS